MERLNADCEGTGEIGENLRNTKVRQDGAWRSPYLVITEDSWRYAPMTVKSRGERLQQGPVTPVREEDGDYLTASGEARTVGWRTLWMSITRPGISVVRKGKIQPHRH